jgi:ribose transport system substrate-binding protein
MEVGVRSKSAAAVFGIALLLSTGCNQERKKRIAVIPKATSHVFWLSVREGALKAGKDLNVEVLWNGPTLETDYSRQIQILDSMVAQRVDGIAIAAAERKALVAPVERATNQGIPVTVFDSGLDTNHYLSYVATDNEEAGGLAARTLAALINNKGVIAVVMHTPGSQSTMDREKGFVDVMQREFPNIQIAAMQFGMSDRAKARAAAENILTAHPNIDGIFASAEPSSVGAALAIKARNLSGKVKLVTFDSSDSLLEDLRGGTIDAMVVQDPQGMGYEAVRTLVDKLNGKQPPKRIDMHAKVLRRGDVAASATALAATVK